MAGENPERDETPSARDVPAQDRVAEAEKRLGSLLRRRLTDAEREVLAEAITGRVPRLERDVRRSVPALFIRRLWLAKSKDEAFGSLFSEQSLVLWLRNIQVSGDLNLAGFITDDRSPLHGIDFRNCDFEGDFNLSHLHLLRLSFSHCRFSTMSLVRATVLGDLIITSSQTVDLYCTVDARKLTVKGDIILSGTQFIRSKDSRNAFNLRGGVVGGSVMLNAAGERFADAKGTVDLREASIGGTLDCHGLVAVVETGEAISANAVTVARGIVLDGAQIKGPVNLRRANVGDDIVATGAHIESSDPLGLRMEWCHVARSIILDEMTTNAAIVISNAEIGGDLSLSKMSAHGFSDRPALDLTLSKVGRILCYDATFVGGGVWADGAEIDGPVFLERSRINAGVGCVAVSFGGASVRGHLSLERIVVSGEALLTHTSVRGTCSLEGARISNPGHVAVRGLHMSIEGSLELRNGFSTEGVVNFTLSDIRGNFSAEGATFVNPGGVALAFIRAKIGGSVFLRRSGPEAAGGEQFKAIGAVHGDAVEIGHDLIVLDATFSNAMDPGPDDEPAHEEPGLLELSAGRIEGSIQFVGVTVRGLLRLNRAQVLGSLDLERSKFEPLRQTAIEGYRLRIGQALNFFRTSIGGDVRLDSCQVGGDVRWRKLVFSRARGRPPNLFSLKGSDLGKRLRARDLSVSDGPDGASTCIIDMTGAKVEALEDDLPEGWGGRHAQLRLEGFRFERILIPKGVEQHSLSESRREWLLQQFEKLKPAQREYRPQVYHALASAQARAGAQDEARRTIVLGERHRRLAGLLNPLEFGLSFLFEIFFGLGLSKVRALATFCTMLAVVMSIVATADAHGFLVRRELGANHQTIACQGFDPVLYSLQLAVPLFGVFQTGGQCVVGASPERDFDRYYRWAQPQRDEQDIRVEWTLDGIVFWDAVFALAKFWGWVITFLTVFTFSGLMRRFSYAS